MYLKNYDISCLINSFAKSNSLFWYYIKQIMNVFIRAMVRIFSFGERWNVLFNSAIASLNRTFHLSPHENILTIALINIHYLYTISQECNRKILLHSPECKSTIRFLLLHSFCFSKNPIRQNASRTLIAVYVHPIIDVR